MKLFDRVAFKLIAIIAVFSIGLLLLTINHFEKKTKQQIISTAKTIIQSTSSLGRDKQLEIINSTLKDLAKNHAVLSINEFSNASPSELANKKNISQVVLWKDGEKTTTLVFLWKFMSSEGSRYIYLQEFVIYFFIFFIFAAFYIIFLRKYKLAPLLEDVVNLQENVMISKTTQMLAHDIRKPFLESQRIFSSLQNLKLEPDGEELLEKSLKELKRLSDNTNFLLQDIIQFGSNTKTSLSPLNIEEFINSSITKCFTHTPIKSDIEFKYKLRLDKKVLAISSKLERILVNILQNASEAMQYKGKIWLETDELIRGDKNIGQIIIGNSNSYIPEEECFKIFDRFYTKGKSNGTGLGLAIVKKIVEEEFGGKISCSSDKTKGTEFTIEFPIDHNSIATHVNSLPDHTRDIMFEIASPKKNKEVILNSNVKLRNIVVVDDSIFVLEAWKMSLKNCVVNVFESPESLFEEINSSKIKIENVDLLITDLYFDQKSSLDGVEFASKLRQEYSFSSPILLSTDAINPTISKNITKVIDKNPISIEKLLEKND